MASISIALTRGTSGTKISDFTVGTAAPTAGQDAELRWNTTDQNSVALKMQDVILMVKAFQRALEQGDSNVNIITFPGE